MEGWNTVRNGTRGALSMSVEERRRRRISQEAFWGHPSKNTKDLATALFPRLLAERLDEIGLDFAIIYPTGGLRVPRVGADKPRRAAARAYNIVTAEYFRPFADRMTPAAIRCTRPGRLSRNWSLPSNSSATRLRCWAP